MSAAPTMRSLGEKGFIRQILPRLSRLRSSTFLVPPGDDAAVMRHGPVLSIDGLTEHTHFRTRWDRLCRRWLGIGLGRALGWKLMGSSLSDLAAMGQVEQKWALLFAGVPGAATRDFMMDFLAGVTDYAQRYRCSVAGGDTVKAKFVTLVAAVGGFMRGKPLTRKGARPGDQLCVAGTIGDAAVGLQILDGRIALPAAASRHFVKRFFAHEPRFQDGERLAKTTGVSSLIDVSDPLQETVEILAGRLGGDVDVGAVPVSAVYRKHFKNDARLLRGGEDYALLFTASKPAIRSLRRRMTLSVIGEISSRRHCRYWLNGRPVHPAPYFQQF